MKNISKTIVAIAILALLIQSAHALPFFRNPDSIFYGTYRAFERLEYDWAIGAENKANVAMKHANNRAEEMGEPVGDLKRIDLEIARERNMEEVMERIQTIENEQARERVHSRIQTIVHVIPVTTTIPAEDTYWGDINHQAIQYQGVYEQIPTDIKETVNVIIINDEEEVVYRVCGTVDHQKVVIADPCIPTITVTANDDVAREMIDNQDIGGIQDKILSGEIKVSPWHKVLGFMKYM